MSCKARLAHHCNPQSHVCPVGAMKRLWDGKTTAQGNLALLQYTQDFLGLKSLTDVWIPRSQPSDRTSEQQ